MARDTISIRTEFDRDTDFLLRKWAAERGLSKRRLVAVVMRRKAVRWDQRRREASR